MDTIPEADRAPAGDRGEGGSVESTKGIEAKVASDIQQSQPGEHPSLYCPTCASRLLSMRCKLICTCCGYYLSCADYY